MGTIINVPPLDTPSEIHQVMVDLGILSGAAIAGVGVVFITFGVVMCFVTRGKFYNKEDVDAMVYATMMQQQKQPVNKKGILIAT